MTNLNEILAEKQSIQRLQNIQGLSQRAYEARAKLLKARYRRVQEADLAFARQLVHMAARA